MSHRYELEKWLWTDKDFEQMGWHDSRVYAVAFEPQDFAFSLDLDYIVQWVHPQAGETYFNFWVAPVTLVFESAYNLEFDLESYNGELEIDNLMRADPKPPYNAQQENSKQDWQWMINCQQGAIRLRAYGFTQYVRNSPRLGSRQVLDLDVRGGISFSRGRAS